MVGESMTTENVSNVLISNLKNKILTGKVLLAMLSWLFCEVYLPRRARLETAYYVTVYKELRGTPKLLMILLKAVKQIFSTKLYPHIWKMGPPVFFTRCKLTPARRRPFMPVPSIGQCVTYILPQPGIYTHMVVLVRQNTRPGAM